MSEKIVLLVEDNPDDEALAIRALRRIPFVGQVAIARDGVEALDYLFAAGSYTGRDLTQMPALILLDLKLPKLNGLEVLQKLRANPSTQFLPVVVLTTSKEDQDLTSSYRLGCNSYICKPVDFVEFTKIIEQIARYWLCLNETPRD
jgi:CheY-like chemotaxis protein